MIYPVRRLSANEVSERYESIPKSAWPKLLAELVEVLFTHYRRHGLKDADAAHRKSARIVILIADAIGGKVLYLPTGEECDLKVSGAVETYLSDQSSGKDALAPNIYDGSNTRYAVHIAKLVRALYPFVRSESDNETAARAELIAVLNAFTMYLGGKAIYVPRGDRLGVHLVHSDITDRLGVTTAMQLADEYETSHIGVYRVAKEQRELRKRKNLPVWNKDRESG